MSENKFNPVDHPHRRYNPYQCNVKMQRLAS